MPEGISLLDLPQAAIGEIEGGNFAYMVTPDGQPYKVEISHLVAKMQADAGCGCVQTAKLFIPSAEVLQLNTTPKAFGLNVPAGYYVQPISLSFATTNTTTAYDTNVIFAVRYVGGGANISTMSSNWGRILTGTVNRGGVLAIDNGVSSTTTETQLIAGADLEALVMNGNPQNGDSDITLYLTYMLIEI